MSDPIDRAADIATALHASPIRGFTHARILRGIAQQTGGGVRRELADALDISTATVTRAISLMGSGKDGLGLIEEGRHLPSGPGRPVAPLVLGRSFAMIGVAITSERGKPALMFGAVCHLDGSPFPGCEAVEPRPLKGDARDSTDDFIEEVEAYVVDLKRMSRLENEHILGCGVTISGYVDKYGEIKKAFGGALSSVDKSVPLKKTLEDRLEIPVIVGNDTTSLAVRKNLRPSQPAENYSLLIALDYGVGGAMVINKETWLGAHGMASEPGHLPATGVARKVCLPDDLAAAEPIQLKMPTCQCENDAVDLWEEDRDPPPGAPEPIGHVEAFASPHAIERRAFHNNDDRAFRPIGELAAQPRSDRKTSLLFYQGGLALGRSVLSAINWIDPERVVIYLPTDALYVTNKYLAGSYYLEGFQEELAKNRIADDLASVIHVRGMPSSVMHQRLASGAAYLVLRRLVRLINGKERIPER